MAVKIKIREATSKELADAKKRLERKNPKIVQTEKAVQVNP